MIREEIRLDFSKIVRKRNDNDEDEDEVKVRETKPKGIIFGDNCFKRIKTDDDDENWFYLITQYNNPNFYV